MCRHSFRILATLTAVLVVGGCGDNSSSPTEMQLEDFVIGAQTGDGAVVATRLNGTPPAANGGPAVTPTVSGSSSAAVVSGGASSVRLRAASPFQTVYLSVIDDPLPGYYKLALATATTDTIVVVKLGPSIPENTFQTVFSVALGDSVGPPSSIANQIKTPTAVAVSGTSPTLGGGAQQFTATASFSDGTSENVTDQSTWQSSASSIAQVTGTGLVSPVAAGEADISAKFGNITGQRRVTIASAAPGTFTVNGSVTDETSGGRLPGVTVAIGGASTLTNASGDYALTGIAGGTITVVASASNYIASQQTISLSANTQVNFVLARVPPTAAIIVQNTPCRDNGNANFAPAPVTCTFAASTANIPSPITYSWTFVNADTGANRAFSGQQISPTFDCMFTNNSFAAFTVYATLQASGGGVMATASQTATVTRAPRVCGVP